MPTRDKRRKDKGFAVPSAENGERETLYILQNKSLMEQIERSMETYEASRKVPS